jgi:hypothetical protein
LEQLENISPGGSRSSDEAAENRATGASLFYHLKNAVNLTLATREVISRLLRSPSVKTKNF